MKTLVYNNTGVHLTMKDGYAVDMNSGACFHGGVEIGIPANGKQEICAGVFVEELLKWRCYQQIHVISGEELLLVLPHDVFQRNRGQDLRLEMVLDGDRRGLRLELVDRTPPRSFAHRIRSMLSAVRGAGSGGDSARNADHAV